ncbi:hypothetical protein ONZ45_g12253 [Pleurotus djamor]|nr:hypothetical protein ONZ45_g12253 [Pleurotus djamor]
MSLSTMSTPLAPSDVTANSINDAKTAQLKKWIEDVNANEGKHVLNKSGKLAELRDRLARYYGLDLTAQPTPPEPTHTPSGNEAIRDHQWDGLVSMGEEWETAVKNGSEFQLTREGSNGTPLQLIHLSSQ